MDLANKIQFLEEQDNSDQVWQKRCKSVKERDLYILEHELWTDCAFLVGQGENVQEIKAHSLYLAKTSAVFEAMLFGENKITTFPILVPDITSSAFKYMLQYIYYGEVNFESREQVEHLLIAASKYQVHHLSELCRKFLCTSTTKVSTRAP